MKARKMQEAEKAESGVPGSEPSPSRLAPCHLPRKGEVLLYLPEDVKKLPLRGKTSPGRGKMSRSDKRGNLDATNGSGLRGFSPLAPSRNFLRSAALSQKAALPVITPSVIACGDATFPKGTAFSGSDKVSGNAQRLHLGGAGALAPEGVTPSRENGIAERPQALRYPEIINILSAIYAQSERGAHFKSSPLTTQSPIWKNSASGCAAATERASDCGAPHGAMRGWRCTGAPDTPCPACASSG